MARGGEGVGRSGRSPAVQLSLSVIGDIESAVLAGNWIETAAAYAGVHRRSLYRWLRRGDECSDLSPDELTPLDRLCVELQRRVSLAEALIEDECARTLARHQEWRARAWYLERRFPARWGRQPEDRVSDGLEVEDRRAAMQRLQALHEDPDAREALATLADREAALALSPGGAGPVLDVPVADPAGPAGAPRDAGPLASSASPEPDR